MELKIILSILQTQSNCRVNVIIKKNRIVKVPVKKNSDIRTYSIRINNKISLLIIILKETKL